MIFRGYIIRSARLTERRRDNTVGRSRRAVDRRPWPRWKGRLDGSPFAVCPQSQGSQERGAMTNQDMLSSASPPCQPSHPSHESHWPLAAKVTEVDFTTPKASLQHGGAPCSLSPSLFSLAIDSALRYARLPLAPLLLCCSAALLHTVQIVQRSVSHCRRMCMRAAITPLTPPRP